MTSGNLLNVSLPPTLSHGFLHAYWETLARGRSSNLAYIKDKMMYHQGQQTKDQKSELVQGCSQSRTAEIKTLLAEFKSCSATHQLYGHGQVITFFLVTILSLSEIGMMLLRISQDNMVHRDQNYLCQAITRVLGNKKHLLIKEENDVNTSDVAMTLL